MLARLVAAARDDAASKMYAHVTETGERTDPRLLERLRGLLSLDASGRVSGLEALRAGPVRLSGPALDKALGRAAAVRVLGAGAVDLSGIPATRVRALARHGMEAKAQALRRLGEPRRTATLVATVAALESAAVDDALDLFDLLMSSKVLGPSRRAAQTDRLAKMPELEAASRVLARAGAELLRVLTESGERIDVAAAWEALEQVASRDRIAEAVAKVGELVPDGAGLEAAMREQMSRRYRTVAPFLTLLSSAVPWAATTAGQPVLDALHGLDGLRGRRRVKRKDIDEKLVPPSWCSAAMTSRSPGTRGRCACWSSCALTCAAVTCSPSARRAGVTLARNCSTGRRGKRCALRRSGAPEPEPGRTGR